MYKNFFKKKLKTKHSTSRASRISTRTTSNLNNFDTSHLLIEKKKRPRILRSRLIYTHDERRWSIFSQLNVYRCALFSHDESRRYMLSSHVSTDVTRCDGCMRKEAFTMSDLILFFFLFYVTFFFMNFNWSNVKYYIRKWFLFLIIQLTAVKWWKKVFPVR